MNNQKKVLFIRVDRIGDLVLTLPVDQTPELNDASVTWWVSKDLEFVLEASQKKRNSISIDRQNPWSEFWRLYRWLKNNPVDVSVHFHGPWWLSLVCFLARVPIRGGRLSQWHSYLFFNKGLRQSRSQSHKHEAEYNFELSSHVLETPNTSQPHLQLKVPESQEILKKFKIDKFDKPDSKSYVVVHPGMGGSSRNANADYYIKLIQKLLEKTPVVITGTKSDYPVIAPIYKRLKGFDDLIWLNEKLSGREVIAILQEAQMVIAPSTGVLHLAASTSVKTLGLFSPVQTQSSNRWGPRGPNISVIEPNVKCPGSKDCLFKKCPYFDCMDTLVNPLNT